MHVKDIIESTTRGFSIEVLPPLKGQGLSKLDSDLDKLVPYGPKFINITSHRTDTEVIQCPDGVYRPTIISKRPGTLPVAAHIKNKYGVPVVPHIVCGGRSAEDIENKLIDLQFLDIENLFLLRGDRSHNESVFKPVPGGHSHASQLELQVKAFNEGKFINGFENKSKGNFEYGVACYPEKHEEAMNLDYDISWLKFKEECGASYAITQLFYDNQRFFDYCNKLHKSNIRIPIIPGLKPLTKLTQKTVLPRVFQCTFPDELADVLSLTNTDADVRAVGVAWAIKQAEELYKRFPIVHFYTVGAVDAVVEILEGLGFKPNNK